MAKKTAKADIPAMDYPEHERTYENFLTFTKWSVIGIVAILIFMAIFLL